MAYIKPDRSNEHIGLNNTEAFSAFMGQPQRKERLKKERAARTHFPGKGSVRRPSQAGKYEENYDKIDWSK